MQTQTRTFQSQIPALAFTAAGISLFTIALIVPSLRSELIYYSSSQPFLMGFIKFSILATAGELIAQKLKTGSMFLSKATLPKAIIWGFFGIVITLMMSFFIAGSKAMMSTGYLPFNGNSLAMAFFASSFMNLTFGVAFMGLHRITDKFIDLWADGNSVTSLADACTTCNWNNFFPFVIGKTIFFFWIPAHTITIMLPSEYRVLAAAGLSIALGIILALSSKK